MHTSFQSDTFAFGAFDLLLVLGPDSINFTQPGLFGSIGQSEASMNAFQQDAFQPFVFQTIPNLLKPDPDWLVQSKKRKWTVFA